METLTKILEKLGEAFARIGWMYAAPGNLRRSWSPRPPKEGR